MVHPNDPTVEAQIASGLRKALGQEYAVMRVLWARMFHVTAQPTQSEAQPLLALEQRKEQARQLRSFKCRPRRTPLQPSDGPISR